MTVKPPKPNPAQKQAKPAPTNQPMDPNAPEGTQTADQPMYIGYMNTRQMPVHCTIGGRSVALNPGQPVIDRDTGLLVDHHAALETLVAQGIISRIRFDNPKFKNFNALAVQRRDSVRTKQALPKRPGEAQSAPKFPDKPTTHVTADAAPVHGTTDVSQLTGSVQPRALPPGAIMTTIDGTAQVEYDGQRFPSPAACNAYFAQKNGQNLNA
jgi:hypothetical protein